MLASRSAGLRASLFELRPDKSFESTEFTEKNYSVCSHRSEPFGRELRAEDYELCEKPQVNWFYV